tara:strand:+ start:40 stop:711 length:672 start_codon:yes stop_codon:yes gene_type:complete
MIKKIPKNKLLGNELGKAATPKALEEYSHSKILTYIDNVKNDDPATMKMLNEYEPNKVEYNSVRGQFQKGNKFGPLSDFKDDLKKDNEFNERFKRDKEKAYQELKTPSLYKNIFPLGKKKKLSDLDLMFVAADPREKMQMRKNYKDYDFTQRQFKEDIPKPVNINVNMTSHISNMQKLQEMKNKSIEDEKRFNEVMKKTPDEDIGKGLGSIFPSIILNKKDVF